MDDEALDPPPRGRAHWTRALLILPFVAMMSVSFYDRIEPALFGVPFFYWYQLCWVLGAAVITAVVYRAEH